MTGKPTMIGTMGIPVMTIKPETEIPLRHELKHRINLREDLVLSQRLKKLFPHDKNAGPDGTYRVTSLYFDTPYDSALREKIDGMDTSFIRLEKKYKISGLCGKRSARMTQEQVKELLSGSSEFLLDSDEPLFIELYSKIKGKGLWPKAIVRYDREAFLYAPGNVRITLDRDIRTGLGCVDFLNSEIFYMRTMEPGTVLEVKYDAYLPELVRMAVQVPGRQAAACSKYALSRRFD